jgi:transglutaminase-like putative cysteine protease
MLRFIQKPKFRLVLMCFVCLLFAAGNAAAQAVNEWRAVTPAELEMKAPQVEPDADAEAIFWEVQLDDKKRKKLSYNHYVRVKIFTERGREKFSKFDIPFYKGRKVENVAARVIKPDGTIVQLRPEDIFEREIIKAGRVRIQAKSFAIPGIEPGVIVEYRYVEVVKNDSLNGERLIFQRDIPMQRATYYVRPYEGMYLNFNFRNMPAIRFVGGTDGFYVGTLTNVPALREEPYMPPDNEVRRWAGLQYGTSSSFTWALLSYQVRESFDKIIKPTKEINQKAAELTAGALTDEEKLRRIYDFTQKRIKNINFDSSYTEEQLESIKIEDADDVLKRGIANSAFVNWLFAALAKAAGFEVNIVMAGDRSENFFNPNANINPGYLHAAGVAVRIKQDEPPPVPAPMAKPVSATAHGVRSTEGQVWKYFDPGTLYLPFGRLVWNEEDVYAMLVGETGHQWRKIPLSGVAQSPARRSGKFKLLEDGTLEGSVKLEYEGHQAITRRRAEFKDSPGKREENIKEEIKKRLSTAEISDLTIENFDNPALPLTYSFKIRVPNYAQKTGKRLFFQPGFFEYGTTPVFSSATRTHNVYFQYPWSEQDDLEFELPKDFLLDSAEAPADVADAQKIGSLKINIAIDRVNNKVIYNRNFYFGNSGLLLFSVSKYEPLKGLFDAFHKADTHTITLKQK